MSTALKCLIVVFCLGLTNVSSSQTISSTKNGGKWENEGTWVNKVIPSDKNNVIINGPVIITSNNSSCNSITINQGGMLQGVGTSTALHIFGPITNNGTIYSTPTETFVLECRGDITNTATWRPSATYIAGSKIQHIFRTPGTIFENTIVLGDLNKTPNTGRLVATSPLTFSGEVDLNGRTLDMDSFSLALKGSAHIAHGSLMNVLDIHMVDSSYFSAVTIRSNVNLHDNVNLAEANFEGDVVNYGKMQFATLRKAKLAGNFTNRGVVSSSTRNQFYNGEFTTDMTDSFVVEAAGYHPPQHLNNPVAHWWKVTSENEEECNSLRFYYSDEVLGDNREKSLWLYQSTDGGQHWAPLRKTNFSQLNSDDNFIEFKNVLLSKENYFALAKDTSRFVTLNIADAGAPQLHGTFPNPVSKQMNLNYSLARGGSIKLSITDESGRVVIPAVDEFEPEGDHQYKIDCSKLPAGVYYASLQQDDVTQVTKFAVTR